MAYASPARPGVLDIAAYVPGKSSAPGVEKVFKSVVERDAARPEPERRSRPTGRRPRISSDISRRPAPICAEASGGRSGSIRYRIVVPDAGSDDLLHLLAYCVSAADGDEERSYTSHGFLIYPIATLGHRRQGDSRGGEGLHRQCRYDPGRRHEADQDRVPSPNPNNPTGTYVPFDEVRTPAPRPAGARAAGADAALCRICQAQRLTKPASNSSPPARNVVMCRTFSKIYGLAACGSAGCSARPRRRCRQPHSAGPFKSATRRSLEAFAANRGYGRHVERSREHNSQWLAGLPGDRAARLKVTPSVANSC